MIGIPHNRCGLQSFFINPQLLNYWLDWLQPALFKRKEASCHPAGELWQKNFSNVWQSQSSLPFWQRSSASLCIWQPMVAVITSSCGYWLGFHLAYRKCLSGSFHLNAVFLHSFLRCFPSLRLRYNRDKSINPPFYAGCGLVCPFVL